MRRISTLVMSCIVLTLLQVGCNTGVRAISDTAKGDRICLEIARRELTIVPVFVTSPVSGFPISCRNVITAAHCMKPPLDVAAVAGFPMKLPPDYDVSKSGSYSDEQDWVVLMATADRFTPNRIDATVDLSKGSRIVIAGYRGAKAPYDAAWHSTRQAEYIVGHVVSPDRSTHELQVIKAEVPYGEYGGFSGAPAAIADLDNHISVWGVVVRESSFRDFVPPWKRHRLLWIARLPASKMPRLQDAKLLNPTEIPNGIPRVSTDAKSRPRP